MPSAARRLAAISRPLAVSLTLVLALAAGAAAKPKDPAPKPGGTDWPPAAWLEVGSRAAWLPFGSFCWKRKCVDFALPADRIDVPAFTVVAGAKATIHLGFDPTRVTVTLYRNGKWGSPALVRPLGRTSTWKPRTTALVQISAFSAHGVASYLVSVKIR